MLISKSDSVRELASALSKFQGAMESVSKDGTNPFFKSKYATLDAIVSAVKAPLASNGLSFSQFPVEENGLETILMHSSGEWLCASAKMSPKDSSPQAHGSMLTYLRRYALSAVLGISTDLDDDGNEASAPKSTTTRVVSGKTEGAYAKAVMAIEKLTTTGKLEEALARLETSTEFSEGEKTKLEALISRQIDVLSESK